MNTKTVYKLTDQNNKTYGGFEWKKGIWAPKLSGTRLCTSGVYHAYHTPELALLLNPLHADISRPKLWRAEVRGNIIDTDNGLKLGLKLGANEMRLVKEINFIEPTTEQRVTFALLCTKEVCKDPAFNLFADNWISGKDRTQNTARAAAAAAAEAAVEAARAAAWAAAWAARAAAAANPLELLISCSKKAFQIPNP